MLSPTPLSLFCALLLCLPLAVVFTITTPTAPTSITSTASTTLPPIPPRKLDRVLNSIIVLPHDINTLAQPDANATEAALPPPPPCPPPPPPPPPIRVDYDDDRRLLRLASRLKSTPSPPFKIAFMFMTTSHLPLAPLWELYFENASSSLYNIYIHADPTFKYDVHPFSGVFSRRVIKSKPTRRNTPTLVSAARRLLAHALAHDASNSHFVLLSASCIPIRSFNFTYNKLASSKKSFIEMLENEVGAYDRWAARGKDVMLPEVKLEDLRIGSQFWVLTRKHARMIVRDRRVWSKFKLPCVRWDTCYPEENYFPTLLGMQDTRGCVRATLTHVDWRGSYDGHPRTYKGPDVTPELIGQLRSKRPRYGDEPVHVSNESDWSIVTTKRHDPFLFARKFAPGALEPLMSMADDVIFRD